MRKTLSALLVFLFLALTNNSFAQTSPSAAAKDSAKAAKKAARAQVKAEKKAAEDAAKAKANTVTTTPTTTPTTTVPKTTTTTVKTQPVNKTADKAIGTDAKGRTIYQGPRGGQYTLTASGNKEYIKKAK